MHGSFENRVARSFALSFSALYGRRLSHKRKYIARTFVLDKIYVILQEERD